MNKEINASSECFTGIINDEAVAFVSVLHFPHPVVKNLKRIHRLVVLPDYQGIGIGWRLLNTVADHYSIKNYRIRITTSNPALKSLTKHNWILNRLGRVSYGTTTNEAFVKSMSCNRITASYEYVGRKINKQTSIGQTVDS